MGTIGAILTEWESQTGPLSGAGPRPHRSYGIGDCYKHDDGTFWVYCQANGALSGDGYAVAIDEDYNATELTNATSAFGDRIGICHSQAADGSSAAVASGEQGWVQVYGASSVRVAANAAANAQLTSTTTTGELDDAAGVGTRNIRGIVLGTAQGGAAGLNANGFLNWPEQEGAN